MHENQYSPVIHTEESARKKRLRYQSWHRGCKETDIILGHFCDHYLAIMSEEELTVFEALLEEDDDILWKWMTGQQSPENAAYLPLIEKLSRFRDYAPL